MSEETTEMGEGGLVPDGRYRARALPETAIWGKASTGTQQIGMSFEILNGKHKGTTLPWYGFFTEDSKVRTMESLIHAGCTFPGDDLGDLTGLGSEEVEVTVECTEHPETGQLRSRVAWVNKPGQVVMKETFDDAEKGAFAKSLKADLLNVKKKNGLAKKSKPKDDGAAAQAAK